MNRYRIAVLPGDGIGPEVMDATMTVLRQVLHLFPTVELQFTPHEAGATHYQRVGEVLPDKVLADCLEADAVLMAAIGNPDVRTADGIEVQPEMMVGLRRAMELYAAIRPIKLYEGVPSPLRQVEEGIDFVIVRENLEGLFASYGGGCVLDNRVATDTLVITRQGTKRVVRMAFRLAEQRNGRLSDGQHVVTCVDKANVFRSFALFRQVFFDVAAQYPEVTAEAAYVDAMSLYMLQQPTAYDVLVMENQFGDILSDLGAALVGGLGLAPSAELGDKHGLFQPSHGSAPTLAGKDVANPLAMILSAAMMLDWLGEKHSDLAARQAADCIERAAQRILRRADARPRDLGGTAGTQSVGQAVADALSPSAQS